MVVQELPRSRRTIVEVKWVDGCVRKRVCLCPSAFELASFGRVFGRHFRHFHGLIMVHVPRLEDCA